MIHKWSMKFTVLLLFCVLNLNYVYAQEDIFWKRIMSINSSNATPDVRTDKLKEVFDQLHKSGKLNARFLVSADKELQWWLLSAVLRKLPKDYIQRLLIDCLSSPDIKLEGWDQKISIAGHLVALGKDCEDETLFNQLAGSIEGMEQFEYKITLANAFLGSRKAEVEKLAITWSKGYRKIKASQAVIGGLGRQLNELLAACGSQRAYAEILANLETFTLIGDQMHSLKILREAKYAGVYEYAKKIANEEEAECPVRVAAVRTMASVASDTSRSEIADSIDRIMKRSGGLVQMYQKELSELKERMLLQEKRE